MYILSGELSDPEGMLQELLSLYNCLDPNIHCKIVLKNATKLVILSLAFLRFG